MNQRSSFQLQKTNKHKDRTIFLRLFTKELIRLSYKKPKFPNLQTLQENYETESKESIKLFSQQHFQENPVNYTPQMPPSMQKSSLELIKPKKIPLIKQFLRRKTQIPISNPIPHLPSQEIPVANPIPQGFNLGKIQPLINDRNIDMIECNGENKPIIVKTNAQIKLTQIKLTKQEIQNTIELFSQATKIPLLGGVFKAALGNLILTAVISDFIGSQFIITKISPRIALYQNQF